MIKSFQYLVDFFLIIEKIEKWMDVWMDEILATENVNISVKIRFAIQQNLAL